MELEINGKRQTVAAALRVDALLQTLGLTGRFAVEVNGEIVPRGEYTVQQLKPGDRVEIVRAIGGG